MGELRGAIDRNHKTELTYIGADGAESMRTIWPLGLFFWGTVWTLGAWCETRHAFRNFRLDRIRVLQILDDFYPDESGRTLEDMIASETDGMCQAVLDT